MGLFRKNKADEQITTLRAELASLKQRLDESDRVKHNLENRVAALTGEIDGLSGAAGAGSAEELDELRENAERLANEQARYQIQFRQDLADLAERLRRARPA
jgi:septal ring factor EnvC (AmiA/AmiB activator)